MKYLTFAFALAASVTSAVHAATINWSASINHGFSLESGSELPAGCLVRLGYFRDPVTGLQMTDAQIQALKTTPVQLDACFVEAGHTTIGSGFTPAIASHFAAVSSIDTSGSGPSLAGKQMYLWVLNAATVAAATEQAILYWNIQDTTTNPDGMTDKPGQTWRFPTDITYPVTTTIDVTDLTTGTGVLAAGARLVVGTYPKGTSSTSGVGNFGLAALEQPLDVTTPSTIAGGSVGVRYTQSLAAVEGRPGYTWSLIGGMLPNGLSMNSDGVISGLPSFAGIFNFVVKATDAKPSSVSKSFTIVIASVPLVISSNSQLPDAGQDASYAINLSAEGGTAPYQWSVVNSSLPDGMTMNSAGLLTGTPTVPGAKSFTVKCTDAGGLETTQVFGINVRSLEIVTDASLNNAFLNIPFGQQVVARGGKAPYTWSLNAGALPLGMTLTTSGLLGLTPTMTGSFSFTLRVEDSLGHSATRTFALNVLGVLVPPQVVPPAFPSVIVGEVFSHQLIASNNPKKFAVKGLPSGLILNTTTGLITGRPKLAGVFALKITATNEAGTSAFVDTGLEVQALPTGSIGSFIGVVAHNLGLNNNLGGRLDLTTTSVGGYTLKLIQGAREATYGGLMEVTRNQAPKINLISGRTKVSLVIDAATNLISGTVTDLAPGGTSASVAGWRQVWKSMINPAITRYGYYSMGIDLTAFNGTSPVPMGTGFAKCVVDLDGRLTITGKAADGSGITTSGFIGPNGEALVYQLLYSKLGSLVGRLNITPDSGGLYTDNVVTGILTWIKPPTKTRTYPMGFGPLTMGVYGKYLARSYVFWNLTGMPNPMLPAALNFAGGGVEASAINPDVASFTFTNIGRVAMPVAGSVANPGRTTLVIPFSSKAADTTNGSIRGGFRLVDGLLVRDVTYEGMIIRSPDNITKAYGFFLLPQIPTGAEKPGTTPILSGQVTITQ